MCAHYKYTKGGLAKLVSISGGWESPQSEGRAVAQYLTEQMQKADGSTSGGGASGSSSGDLTRTEKPELSEAYPGDEAEILILDRGVRKIIPSKYGLVPTFIPKGKSKPSCLYNARDDSIQRYNKQGQLDVKASFRDAFFRRRCIAAISIVEENMGGHRWLQVRHATPGQDFFVAAIYNKPHPLCKDTTHALVTTAANEMIEPYNDRFPVVLTREEVEIWLDPKSTLDQLFALFKICPLDWIGEITVRNDPRFEAGLFDEEE